MMSKQKSESKPATSAKLASIPKPKRANAQRFELADQHREVFSFLAPAGTQFDEVLAQEFWAPVAERLQPWCRVEIAEESGKWWAELLVQAITSAGVVMSQLRHHALEGVGRTGRLPVNTGGRYIEFGGAFLKWTVKDADGNILIDRLPKEVDARSWLESQATTQPENAA